MKLTIQWLHTLVADFNEVCDEIHALHRDGKPIPPELTEAVATVKGAALRLEDAL